MRKVCGMEINMKYVVVIGDGMADEPLVAEGGKTPLELANTPMFDQLAQTGEMGLVKTVPEGMEAGSDVANLSILGCDPKRFYTGRAPLEALGLGIPLQDTDVVYRCNLVTLEEAKRYEDMRMLDHTADQIATVEAKKIINKMQNVFDRKAYQYYTETSYRHLLVWKHGEIARLVPPHDILGKRIGRYLPKNAVLREIMQESHERLKFCRVNVSSIWLWGGGKKGILPSFEKKYHKKAAMISAVAILKGIAAGMGMTNLTVQGATGTFDTNYEEKALRAVKALLEEQYDLVCIHIEAPDAMSHQGDQKRKIKAIEKIDQDIVYTIHEQLKSAQEPFRLLILPDHGTSVIKRCHLNDPVPYLLWDNKEPFGRFSAYNEKQAELGGIYITEGTDLLMRLFS